MHTFSNKLENNLIPHVVIYVGITTLLFYLMYLFIDINGSIILTMLLVSFLVYELMVRCVFLLNYGVSYRNKFYSPILVNSTLYGYSFPKSFNSKVYNRLLFENWMFKSGKSPTNLNENISKRMVFNTNSIGFRGSELSSNKIRIVCCGGSTTACDKCDDDETWVSVLNNKLHSINDSIEVVNAGTQGWYSYHDLLRIKNEIINLKPSVLILHQGWNEEFEYSSLNLGRDWIPNSTRSNLNANIFYKKNNVSFIENSLNRLISYYLIKKIYFSTIFRKQMCFTNIERWNVLKKEDYLGSWFDVLNEIKDIAYKNNILVYMIDPPSLVEMEDTRIDRSIYINNSRLDRWFAEYQSVSSFRTSNFLKFINDFIPVINCKKSFANYKGKERIELFHDEIHLTSKGNNILADTIFSFFKKNLEFLDLQNDKPIKRDFSMHMNSHVKSNATSNPKKIDKYIDGVILKLKRNKNFSSSGSIPTDRYTTF